MTVILRSSICSVVVNPIPAAILSNAQHACVNMYVCYLAIINITTNITGYNTGTTALFCGSYCRAVSGMTGFTG